jgi:ribonuclease BN (tRNA processing enzyme)
MKLIFIGAGSAFTIGGNYNSNMLLVDENNDKKLLIDCGSDARHALADLGYSYKDIHDVYISHLHADHAGGLEWLALTNKFDPTAKKPNLYAHAHVLKQLWTNTLSGGMRTLQGVVAELEDFFTVHKIHENGSFVWNNGTFQLVQMIHIVSGFEFMPSYGLIFTIKGTRIFITSDTQFAPLQLVDFYKSVDIIFQDCETAIHPSGVHAHFNELMTLDESIKKKMWLYHYNPGELPDAKKYGFCGFVHRKQVFEF